MDAEKGKPSTGIAVYAALLWTYDLLGQLSMAGDPDSDEEGKTLAISRARLRARAEDLDNEF
jgi:hypothetical protein